MPQEIGPGRYDLGKAENFIGNKRRDFCMSKLVPISFCQGSKVAGHNGLMFVGNSLQFDPEASKFHQRLSKIKRSKVSASLYHTIQREQIIV